MRSFIRWFVAIPVAVLVTLLLFVLIANQIAPEPFIYRSAEDPGKVVVFGNLVDCRCGDWRRHGPTLPPAPKEDSSNAWTRSDKATPEPPLVEAEKPVMPEIDNASSPGLHYCKGSGFLLDPVTPQYPNACIEKRAEGAVVVQFDITKEGDVVNVSIVESPDRCFNSAVLSAMSKRRYPRMCNAMGELVARRGEQEVFRFVIEE